MKSRIEKNIHKLIAIVLTIVSYHASQAQVKGNKEIETRSFTLEEIESIKINFYADVTIDCDLEEVLDITTDSNLFDLIEKEVSEGELSLGQKEWISPSQRAVIRIGAPSLKKLTTGTHEVTRVINIDNDEFYVISPVGNVILEGRTGAIRISNKVADIDASQLIAENGFVNITSWGSVTINVRGQLNTDLADNAALDLVSKPESINGDAPLTADERLSADPDVYYIDFKIRNNSANRNSFIVVGPKPDGREFSYGFPMMPLATRKERWTTGTRIYKVNKLGLRELLVTISPEDEGQTVRLFTDK